jgi:hypothetical protein
MPIQPDSGQANGLSPQGVHKSIDVSVMRATAGRFANYFDASSHSDKA